MPPNLKVLSSFIQKLIQTPACTDHGLYRILSSYWLAHLYLMNLFFTILVGLQDVGILQILYSQAVIQRTIVDSPAFLDHGLAEKITVCTHTTMI
jgi:hypothetical protein